MAIRIRNAIALNIFHGTVDLVKEVAEATASAVASATAEVVEAKKLAFAGGAVTVAVGAFAGGAVGVTVAVEIGAFAGGAVGTTLTGFLGILFTFELFVGSPFRKTRVSMFRFGGISLSCIP